MTISVNRRAVYIAAILLAVIGVVVGVAFAARGPEPGSLAGFKAALHPYNVSAAGAELQRAADRGASPARLLVLTNQLLVLVESDSAGERRRAIDGALASLSGAGCLLCESALELARP